MKIKALVGALALISAGNVFAATSPSTTGNGELFLSVYDPVAKISYMRDLGIALNDFLPSSALANTNNVWTADANWLAFVNQVDMNLLQWDVKATDSIGSGLGGHRYLSTSTAPLSIVDDLTNAKAVQLKQVDDFINANNNLLGSPANVDYAAETSTIAGETDGLAYGGLVGDKWKGQSNFSSVTSVGNSMSFFYITPSSTSGLAKASVTQYTPASNGAATWTLGADGSLAYAVPEADTYAMFGIGSLVVAGMLRRRKKAASI
jgi:hypothetical protein